MPASDADLVRAYLERRDEDAFRQLVERHAPPVLRTAHRITGDLAAAEDATQDTFLAVMRGLARYDQRRSFRAWTLGIAVKCAGKVVRGSARRKRREEERPMSMPQQPTPDEAAHRREIDALLASALERVPEQRRAALHLHYREGLSLAEVAEALGISPGTAKSRIARGLEELRERLGHGAIGPLLLPELLAGLNGPSPTPALLKACATKALAVGPAAAAPLAKKLVAAILLAGAGTVAAVGILGGNAPARPRAHREALAPPEHGARIPAPADLPASADAPPESARRTDRAAEPETVAADAPRAPGMEAGGAGGPAPGDEGKEPRKVWRTEDLPEGTQVVRGGDGSRGASMEQGAGPGRFEPVQRGYSKFAPPPRFRGEATLRGRVIDAQGMPVEGAEVYRMPLNVDRSQGTVLSFEFLFKVATSGADGAFEAGEQEHGTFYLVANYARLLNRPRGMETRDAVVVEVAEKGLADAITLRLPVEVAELVPLKGVVTDAEGRPVRGAQVFVDYLELRTDAEGRFDAGKVPIGIRSVVVRRTGYVQLEGTVEAARGRENVAQLVLELKEKGELRLAGHVLDASGGAVPEATVYVNAPGETVRSAQTDAQGHYSFDQLPLRLQEKGCTITVWAKGYFPKHVPEAPLPAESFEIRVERAVRLVVSVVSDATGEPLTQIRGEVRREMTVDGKVEFRMFRSWSVYRENGILDDLDVPPGKIQLELEAPGHAVATLDLDIAPDTDRKELSVRLQVSG